MKFLRIFPEMCARTMCLFSSSTRNMAFGQRFDHRSDDLYRILFGHMRIYALRFALSCDNTITHSRMTLISTGRSASTSAYRPRSAIILDQGLRLLRDRPAAVPASTSAESSFRWIRVPSARVALARQLCPDPTRVENLAAFRTSPARRKPSDQHLVVNLDADGPASLFHPGRKCAREIPPGGIVRGYPSRMNPSIAVLPSRGALDDGIHQMHPGPVRRLPCTLGLLPQVRFGS